MDEACGTSSLHAAASDLTVSAVANACEFDQFARATGAWHSEFHGCREIFGTIDWANLPSMPSRTSANAQGRRSPGCRLKNPDGCRTKRSSRMEGFSPGNECESPARKLGAGKPNGPPLCAARIQPNQDARIGQKSLNIDSNVLWTGYCRICSRCSALRQLET